MRVVTSIALGALLLVFGSAIPAFGVFISESESGNNGNTLGGIGISSQQQNVTANFHTDLVPDPGLFNPSVPHVSIHGAGDGTFDFYAFHVAVTSTLYVDLDTPNTATGDSVLGVWTSSGAKVATNDDGNAPDEPPPSPTMVNSYISATLLAPGDYVVGVAEYPASFNIGGFNGSPPTFGDYDLFISLDSSSATPEPATLLIWSGIAAAGAVLNVRRRWTKR